MTQVQCECFQKEQHTSKAAYFHCVSVAVYVDEDRNFVDSDKHPADH